MKGTITSTTPYDSSHPDALAVYCSDGRFTHAVAGLLEKLGYDRLDTLTIPGGPGLFEMSTSSLTEVDTLRKAASFLVVGHHIKHVTLLAHEGCGYYKAQLSHEPPETIERRQRQDLLSSAAWMRAMHREVEVATFFARIVSGKVVFETVV